MDAQRWEQAKELFHAASELPTAERETFVLGATSDELVRAEVRSLLAEIDSGAAAAAAEAPPQCDRYVLETELGRGGFGTVHRARQLEPVQRTVAVKVLRAGPDAARLVARFSLEREAVARMSHPHIAQIHDAGTTTDGRPFIAMEFVDGVPLTHYCDRHRLSIAARLRLLVSVSRGVHHAHQKGVIHRDLKPSNVLVAEIDGRPVPKIIDFGIASATRDEAVHEGAALATGGKEPICLGTPGYLSPEQADLGRELVDVRSDVYALGVLLFELLTGRLPHDVEAARADGLWRYLEQLRKVAAPAPSSVVDARDVEWGARRGGSPRVVWRQLRGELDWITLRALERDPAQRYQSADELAAELLRWLHHEPVRAGPATAWYRFRKLLRRQRLATISGLLVLLSLVLGLATALWQNRIAKAALQDAIGHRLCAEVNQVVEEDPTRALWMAVEGAKRVPGEDADAALYTALARHHEDWGVPLHDDVPRWSVLSADGRVLLSADDSGLVLATDAATGATRARFDVHADPLLGIALAPGGDVAVSFDAAGTCHRLDLAAGVVVATVRLRAAVVAAAWVAAADVLLLDADGNCHRWRDGDPVRIATDQRPGRALAVAPQAGRFAVLGGNDELTVRSLADGALQLQRSLSAGGADPDAQRTHPAQLVFTADGASLVALGAGGRLDVVDLVHPERSVVVQPVGCRSVAVATRSGRVAYGIDDGGLEVFEASSGDRWSMPWSLPGRHPAALAIDPHGRTLVAVPRYQPVAVVFDADLRLRLAMLRGEAHALYAPQVGADGAWLTAAEHNGNVHRWRAATFDERRTLARTQPRSARPDWVPLGDGAALRHREAGNGSRAEVVDSQTGAVRLELDVVARDAALPTPGCGGEVVVLERDDHTDVVDVTTGTLLGRVPGRLQRTRTNAAARHVVGRRGEQVVVHEVATGRQVFAQVVPGAQYYDVDARGERVVIAGGGNGLVTVWSVATGQLERTIQHRAFVFDACFDVEGRHVLSFGNDTTLRRTPIAGTGPTTTMRTPTGDFGWLRSDPSGRHVVAIVPEETVVFDLATGRRRWRWRPADPAERCREATFCRDGSGLWVQSNDGRLRRVPLDPLAAATAQPLRGPAPAELRRLGLPGTEPVRALPSVRNDIESALQQIAVGSPEALEAAEAKLVAVAAMRRHPPSRFYRARLLLAGQRAELAGVPPTGAALDAAQQWLEACLRTEGITADQAAAHPQLRVLRKAPPIAARLAQAR